MARAKRGGFAAHQKRVLLQNRSESRQEILLRDTHKKKTPPTGPIALQTKMIYIPRVSKTHQPSHGSTRPQRRRAGLLVMFARKQDFWRRCTYIHDRYHTHAWNAAYLWASSHAEEGSRACLMFVLSLWRLPRNLFFRGERAPEKRDTIGLLENGGPSVVSQNNSRRERALDGQ